MATTGGFLFRMGLGALSYVRNWQRFKADLSPI